MLVSHLHWDHFDVPSLQMLDRSTHIIAPRGSGALLRRHGIEQVTELRAGETNYVGPTTIEATYAEHTGSIPFVHSSDAALGFLIYGDHRIYFAGDTDLFSDMVMLSDRLDVALLPVWGAGGRRPAPATSIRVVLLRVRHCFSPNWPYRFTGGRSSRWDCAGCCRNYSRNLLTHSRVLHREWHPQWACVCFIRVLRSPWINDWIRPREKFYRQRKPWLTRVVVVWIIEVLALVIMNELLGGLTVASWQAAFVSVAVIGLLNAVLWPLLNTSDAAHYRTDVRTLPAVSRWRDHFAGGRSSTGYHHNRVLDADLDRYRSDDYQHYRERAAGYRRRCVVLSQRRAANYAASHAAGGDRRARCALFGDRRAL